MPDKGMQKTQKRKENQALRTQKPTDMMME